MQTRMLKAKKDISLKSFCTTLKIKGSLGSSGGRERTSLGNLTGLCMRERERVNVKKIKRIRNFFEKSKRISCYSL